MALQFLLIYWVLLLLCGGRGHYSYKLHKAGITIFSQSFPAFSLTYTNLVNSCTRDWACTTTSVPQGSLLSPFIFLVFTADMTLKEPNQTPEIYPQSLNMQRILNFGEQTSTNTNCYNQPRDLVPKIANINQHLKNKLYYLLWQEKIATTLHSGNQKFFKACVCFFIRFLFFTKW